MPAIFCIVDDEREVCDLLRLFFESRGHRCYVAGDGKTGLALVRQHRPAAVFLDVQMPGMNGYEVLLELKRDEVTKAIPVMLMTALVDARGPGAEPWLHGTGADAFLAKPFVLDELMAAVEKLTGIRV